jgi:hypothetical protein
MTGVLVGLVVLAVLYAVFHILGRRAAVHQVRLVDLGRFVSTVRARAQPGGHFLIRPPRAETPFLQLRRVADGPDALEVGFPRVGWSETAFPDLERRLQLAGIEYEVLPGSGAVKAFITVNCGADEALATRVLGLAGAAIGWEEQAPLRLTFHGVD